MKIKAWGPFFTLLALLAAGLTGMALQYSKPHNQTEPAKAEQRDSSTAKPETESAAKPDDSKGKKKQDWYESFFEKPTDTLLVLFNGLLALYTWRLYLATRGLVDAASEQSSHMQVSITEAKRAGDVAEKALIASNRPWVKVDILVGGPIYYNENGANFTFNYILTNIGHAPATNVWVSRKIIAPDPTSGKPFNPRAELQADIAQLKSRPPSPWGFALFPGDKIIQPITVPLERMSLRGSRKNLGPSTPKSLALLIIGWASMILRTRQVLSSRFVVAKHRAQFPSRKTDGLLLFS